MTFLSYVDTQTRENSVTVASQSKRELNPFFQKARTFLQSQKAFWVATAMLLIVALGFGYRLNGTVYGLVYTLLALVALAVLVTISYFILRNSEITRWQRMCAVIWGGVFSILLTFGIIILKDIFFGSATQEAAVVVQAAVVEEIAKGLYLSILAMFFFSYIRTPLVGLGLGLLVGAGFAFTENITYFHSSFSSGGWEMLWSTFGLRVGMSFFLHSSATMFTGLMIGYVISRRHTLKWWAKYLYTVSGLLAAMAVHGMWNGMASLTTIHSKWVWMYWLFWVPFVLGLCLLVYLLRRNESKRIQETAVIAVEQQYLIPSQMKFLKDAQGRKKLRKLNPKKRLQISQWERSLQDTAFWKEERSYVKRPRKAQKYSKKEYKRLQKFLATNRTLTFS